MTTVSLGEHSKLTVLPSERHQIRKFYRDVLGCALTRESEPSDVFRIGKSFFVAVVYDETALSVAERFKSIWLELRTPDLEGMKKKIIAFGIEPLEYHDRENFYFQAPGGQVFRLISDTEDMSKVER